MIGRHGILLLGVVLGLASCAPPSAPTHFYALAPIQPPAEETAASSKAKPLVLGVGPVSVAEYLKRPQIVSRASETELRLADFDQWVEPFDILFPRVLAQDLAALLGTDRVNLAPAPRDVRLDFAVEVDVIRFDDENGTGVVLDALWRIYGRDGDRLVDQGRARITRPVVAAEDGSRYPAIVVAMGEATGDLARLIADAIVAKGGKRK